MKKKNIFNIIMGIVALIVVVSAAYFGFTQPNLNSGTAGSRWSNENGVSEIKRRGYIRVAVFGDLPPYGWVNDQGKRVGYDVYLARRIAKDLNVKIRFIQVNANNRVDTLNSNKADIVLANFTVTPERKDVVDFAKPYMKVSVGVISPKNAPINSAQELKGKKLIVTKGTTAENYFAKQSGVNLLKFDSKTQQFNALKNGRGAALADDNSYLYAWVKKNPKYVVGIKSIGPRQYVSPAVKKGNRSLLKWTNHEITKLTNEGFFVQDYQKKLAPYFGKDIKPTDIVLR
ncbi:transporter substrate-binding domain-containing protein [Lactobacillus helveticus]|jgi:polar amino acid transport system substrate-binding protein|uniref:ABC superfamily ATP binding cassette transporter,binding protein n=2 Tax=Lactobacillus helveticus TaxID=1587 RepID=U4QBY0_LACHE|nr:transporter substrate-binding domain-containing protein [Lactobacillus helveticus]ALI52526.1 ABC transporter substrate-binding protein [Lactobacillus helveticus]NRN72016.1 ABC transporter glutamine-binding protein GlnH [Lactobacillus helveticus]NRN75205.1 ABC transporter glutamine-binding protein GlnH [Lactobacillus helveticus]NRN76401.1 ABC transporter glutamine-binding protein GlnH [Lactobacillus helveticus]NRN78391.1 ABC transporter glutamine-binding protein GlnH [Lactobacillus helveticu